MGAGIWRAPCDRVRSRSPPRTVRGLLLYGDGHAGWCRARDSQESVDPPGLEDRSWPPGLVVVTPWTPGHHQGIQDARRSDRHNCDKSGTAVAEQLRPAGRIAAPREGFE